MVSVQLGYTGASNSVDGATCFRPVGLLWLPAGDPEEEEAVVLQDGNVEFSHLIVSQCSIRQLHVDVPRRVGHHHGKLPEDGHVQEADIAADPLQEEKHGLRQIRSPVKKSLSEDLLSSSVLSPCVHLRGEQLAHVAVGFPRTEAELRAPGLRPLQAPLGLRRAVDLIVDVFAGVHVETRVEEGAVAEALVRVLVDDATKIKTAA